MSSSGIRQAEFLRRQRAAMGVGVTLILAAVVFAGWSAAVGRLALVRMLGGVMAVSMGLLVAARRGHVRVAGLSFSLLALAAVVGGSYANGHPGNGAFYLTVGVVLAAITLEPRDAVVVFGLGLLGQAALVFMPESAPNPSVAPVWAEGLLLYLLVGVVGLAMSGSVARLVKDLWQRDADALAADQRAEALAHQLEENQRMEALGRLAVGIAHDFNNLLAVMQSCAGMVETELPPDSAARADVKDLHDAIARGASLTGQLLAFSRRDVAKAQVLNLCDVVRGMTDLVRRMVGDGVTVAFEPCAAPCPVWASTLQLEQVVMNLVVNARDALGGRGALTLKVAHGQDARLGAVCRLTVADDGPGMSEEVRARIFEPFFTTKAQGKGTGLGLATVYGVVTRYGGRVDVDSAPGRGAAFHVVLPLVTTAPVAAVEAAPAPSARTGALVVYVVDDEPLLRNQMQRILSVAGLTVECFESAEQLLGAGKTNPGCDVLVTDVNLPGRSGVALAEALLQGNPALKVVLVSGFTADPTATAQLVSRGAHFLAKPSAPEALVAAVKDGRGAEA